LLIMPVYYAGGSVTRQMDSDELVRELNTTGLQVSWVETYERMLDLVLHEAQPGDVVLCMGARDPGIPQFAADLVQALAAG
jgi:UDP-N-acetylmuramate--alanine ligase